MKTKVIKFLRTIFPFAVTLGVWRLSVAFWNPGGVLAMIPIFFYSFVKPTPWFALYGAVVCFLIDYKFDTVCFWTAMYCLWLAINEFQNFINMSRLRQNGIQAFLVFWSIAVILQGLANPGFTNILRAIWLLAWGGMLYIPATAIFKRIDDD